MLLKELLRRGKKTQKYQQRHGGAKTRENDDIKDYEKQNCHSKNSKKKYPTLEGHHSSLLKLAHW